MRSHSNDNLRVERYLRFCAQLRIGIQYLIEDFEFSQNRNKIVYLTDPGAVTFFLKPSRYKDVIEGFEPDTASEDHVAPTTLITAELLFSRYLPGQSGEPLLIAPGHGDSLRQILEGITRNPRSKVPKRFELQGVDRARLKRIIDQISNRFTSSSKLHAELHRLIPDVLNFVHGGPLAEITHLHRLYEEHLLLPLASHSAATSEILDLRHENKQLVAFWVRNIQDGYRQSVSKSISDKHRSRNIGRFNTQWDAEALVQTILLDSEAIKGSHPVKYLMITTNRSVLDAYTQWFWSSELRKDNERRFVLRPVSPYVPMLHLYRQRGPNEIFELIFRIRDALDTLFTNRLGLDSHYPWSLSILTVGSKESKAYVNKSPGFKDVEIFQGIIEGWAEILRTSVILNTDAAAKRMQAELVPLITLLQPTKDFRQSLLEYQRRMVAEIHSKHLLLKFGIV
jgi:hypothetical protein